MSSKKKILFADDVKLFVELEKTFFNRDESDLLVAYDGNQALEIAKQERPSLIFMDLHMPEMDGDECCSILKGDPKYRDIPVVMVTHGGRDEDLDRCKSAGCDEAIFKPISRHSFLAVAGRFLAVSERGTERYEARLCVRFGLDAELLTKYSVNLSTGGLFLETDHILPLETPLSIEFILPDVPEPIRCSARVAWINHPELPNKPHLPVGMGLQFRDITLKDLDAIRDFIKKETLAPSW
jgi:uncharacterized protein (TIGR02266 family)